MRTLLLVLAFAACTAHVQQQDPNLPPPPPGTSQQMQSPPPPPSSGGGCTKDTDCKGDRVCNRGTCMAPNQ